MTAEQHIRPECQGFIGFMLGHRYPERWSYAEEKFEQVLYCTRCGLSAEGVRPREGKP